MDVTTRYPNGETPLLVAAGRGRDRIVRELLGRVGDGEVNVCARGGRRAIMMAALGGWAGVVELLVNDPRCEVRVRDDIGRDVPWYARVGGCLNVLEGLLGRECSSRCVKGAGDERSGEGVEAGVGMKEGLSVQVTDTPRKGGDLSAGVIVTSEI